MTFSVIIKVQSVQTSEVKLEVEDFSEFTSIFSSDFSQIQVQDSSL